METAQPVGDDMCRPSPASSAEFRRVLADFQPVPAEFRWVFEKTQISSSVREGRDAQSLTGTDAQVVKKDLQRFFEKKKKRAKVNASPNIPRSTTVKEVELTQSFVKTTSHSP